MKNMGLLDRIIRISAAAVIMVLILTGILKGVLAIIFGIVGVIFVFMSLTGSCPVLRAFKMSTLPKD